MIGIVTILLIAMCVVCKVCQYGCVQKECGKTSRALSKFDGMDVDIVKLHGLDEYQTTFDSFKKQENTQDTKDKQNKKNQKIYENNDEKNNSNDNRHRLLRYNLIYQVFMQHLVKYGMKMKHMIFMIQKIHAMVLKMWTTHINISVFFLFFFFGFIFCLFFFYCCARMEQFIATTLNTTTQSTTLFYICWCTISTTKWQCISSLCMCDGNNIQVF